MALMGAPVDRDQELEERMRNFQKEYINFLNPDDREDDTYAQKIGNLIQEDGSRLIVSVDDMRKHCPDRAKAILQTGFEEIIAFQRALKEVISNINPEFAETVGEFSIGFEGSFGSRHVNPRSLKSMFIGQMVCCEGIVAKCSLVRPKVVRSVHYCPVTGKSMERNYADLTSYDGFPTSSVYPQEDENKNPLETEYGLSTYMDQQTLVIQEMPEIAPAGQMPRTVEIIAHDDMVDRCKPGDRIWAVGVYRALPSKHAGFTSGSFRTVLLANNIQLLSKEATPTLQHGDVKLIRNVIKKEKNCFEMLAKSLAPSVHGHEFVKQAILCMLLGGLEKILPNGTRLRGDINLLLIGDPSVAKSQLLRYVLQAAPRAVAATGRGSSGVGLTAAVTSDPDSGERRLEAGAMVMADRGIVCIDEFDKMTDTDRTAIHEVMEQGRVTIAKAGIHARLNARCSVLAAANPIRGSYDQTKDPMVNIGMQDSLLSRFDLIFILLDKHDETLDSAIADHVLAIHRYRNPGEEDGAVLDLEGSLQTLTTLNLMEEREKATQVYEQAGSWIPTNTRNERFFTVTFMKKFIHLAKLVKPTLTLAATEYISTQYADLRQSEMQKSESERTTPVTARTLETMIRLATAHAKARFCTTVDEVDARKAYDLLHFACFKEAPKRIIPKRKRKRDGVDSDEENAEEETALNAVQKPGDQVQVQKGKKGKESGKPEKKKDKTDTGDVYDFDMDDDSDIHEFQATKKTGATVPQALSVDRYKAFQRYVRIVFDTRQSAEQLPLQEVIDEVQKLAAASTSRFSDGELKISLEQLCSDNAAMISDDVMILI